MEKAALAVVFSARRLRHYFHSFTILVMTDLPIQKVLKKPDAAGFDAALEQFACQYPDLDLSMVSLNNEVVDGKIVPSED